MRGNDAERVAAEVGIKDELPSRQLLVEGDDGLNGGAGEVHLHAGPFTDGLIGTGGGLGRRRDGSLKYGGLASSMADAKHEDGQDAGHSQAGDKTGRGSRHGDILW
jgi:hypothetical protein